MAWPNPFRRRDSNTRTAWGYTFQLTADHLTPARSHPLKYSYDTLGEECLDILNQISPPNPQASTLLVDTAPEPSAGQNIKSKSSKPKRDLYIILEANRDKHEKLQQLWSEVTNIPDWVDWDQIARGQEIFCKHC